MNKIFTGIELLLILLLVCSCRSKNNEVSDISNETLLSNQEVTKIVTTLNQKEIKTVTIDDINPIIQTAEKYMMSSQYFINENEKWIIQSNDKILDGKTLDEYKREQEELYKNVFTQKMIDSIPKPNETSNTYVYSIGLLSQSQYKYGGDRGIDITYAFSDWELIKVSDNDIKLINRSFYISSPDEQNVPRLAFKDHKLIEVDSEKEYTPVNGERLETYTYTMLLENGQWKFASFSLWQ